MNPTDLTASCDDEHAVSATGTKAECMKWYIYDDSGNTYKMILDHNTTARTVYNSSTPYVAYNNASIKNQVDSDTTGWDSRLYSRLITANEIATITGNTGWNSSNSQSYFYFGSNDTTKYSNQSSEQIAKQRSLAWLFDYIYRCDSYGCNIADLPESNTNGYWTSSSVSGLSSYAWYVSFEGRLNKDVVPSTTNGVRPVIEIDKSLIDS